MASNNRNTQNNHRARLLSGVSSVALSVASMVVALGVCAPGDARAQTVNPVQTTTYDLSANNPVINPIIFGATTSIDTSVTAGSTAVTSGGSTAWNVSVDTQAVIKGDHRGIDLFSTSAVTLNNSGTISQTATGSVGDAAIAIGNGGTVINQASGQINAARTGILSLSGQPLTVENSGNITAGGDGILGVSSVINHTGGKITANGGDGINMFLSGATVINEQGASISGTTNGVVISGSDGSVTNAGTISASPGGASVKFTGTGTNTLILRPGSALIGDAVGSTAAGATNNLVLQGSGIGSANNNFVQFNSLEVQSATWALGGSADVGTATVSGGTLEVTGTGTLIGSTTVQGGGLIVNGTLIGAVNVMSGGLSGVGTINGSLLAQSAAVVAPGNQGTPGGTLTVTGNANFATGSTFSVNVTPTQTVKLAVGGTATLTGGTVSVQAQNSGTYAPSTPYTILTATGGLGGTTFAGVLPTNLAFLTPSLSYTANDVTLTLVNNGGGGGGGGGGGSGGGTGGTGNIFATVTQTQNQNAVANALDPNAATNPLILAVLNQTADGARQAFDALSGEVFGSVHTVQAGETQFARSAMLGRMRQASYASYVGELGALAFGGPELAYAGDNANGAYAADISSAVPGKAPVRDRSRDLVFWAQGLGGWGHTDSDGNAAAVSGRFGGFLSGVDARFGETLRAGFVAGYLRSDLNADARASSAGIDSVQIGAYAGGQLGVFNVRGGASYSFDSIDVSRGIFFPVFIDQTKASFHGNVGQVFGEIGYGMTLGLVAVEPLAGLAYVHVHDGSFLESGGAAALSGSSTHEDIGYSFLGFRAATVLPLANGTALVPRAMVQWQHAFGDVTPVVGLAFQGTGAAFSVAGVPIARNTALIETGFDWRFSPRAKLGAFYQGELAAHAESHAFKGTFSWNF